jgi:beta-ribofuranosylaminobenzene 5'-phosphate synthase
MRFRLVAPCRLHFGLFHVPVDGLTHDLEGRPVRKFGGLGLMIDLPSLTVTIEPSSSWRITGDYPERVLRLAKQVNRRLAELQPHNSGQREWPSAIHATGPIEHTGLGVGTALGMAVARILSTAVDMPDVWFTEPQVMAGWVERGRRSGIGIFGFEQGGFIVDDGKIEDELPQLVTRLDFPTDWRILLVRPPVSPVWYGDRERSAFARTRPAESALALSNRLRAIAYETIVPAVQDTQFDTFAQSIFEFNQLAGEPFRDDQGGPYANTEVACIVDELQELGAVGVGQSSWGPTVFGFVRDADEAEHLAQRARERFSSETSITVSTANNSGMALSPGQ